MNFVKCNWCECVFTETDILVENDLEFCPHCQQNGFLMDVDN